MRLQNKVALITGGTSGIGEATAILFAKEGAKIAITGRNEKRGNAVTEQITRNGGHAVFVPSDVRKSNDCQLAVDEILRAFDHIDILFNNAGVFYPHTTLDCSEEEWDEQIDINLKGTFLMSKAVLPHMVQRRQGIRVNCICPGDVDTPMLPEDARMRGMKWEDYLAGCANRPLGRIGTADEIAKAALFLASDDSSFMTGAALVVDGGGSAD